MEMVKMENNEIKSRKLIPRLRFPGFEGEWNAKTIGEVADVLQGFGFPDKYQGQTSGELPFCKVGDISAAVDRGEQTIYKAANYVDYSMLPTLHGKPIPVGATVFAKIGEAIRSNKRIKTAVPCLIDNNVAAVKARDSITDDFLFYVMSQINLADYAGGIVPSVNKSVIEAIQILLTPIIPEQQKIASCLSELDNLIAAQGQKVDALKEKKKGLMQQLFPQPGETTPRLRFPGFEGEWEEKKLGEVFEKINNGMAYNTYLTEGYPMSRIETISSGEIDYDRVGYSDIEPNEKYKLLVGDLLFSHINSETRIGRIAMYRGEKALYHGMNLLLLRAGHLYDKFFVFYQMDRTETRTNIQKLAKKAINQASVSTSDLKQVSVMIPPYLTEQQKIASCLSSLDDLIAAESAKVEALKDHKKGLMQQLFPQPTK